MREFSAFVKKEFLHIMRDRRSVLILLAMPVVMIILFGFALTTEINNVKLMVVDPSPTPLTEKIVERFRGNYYFDLKEVRRSAVDADALFRTRQADIVVVLEQGLEKRVALGERGQVQLLVDGTDPNTATTLINYATGVFASMAQENAAGTGGNAQMPAFTIVPEIKLLYNPGMKSAYNFVPGVMGFILMLICSLMTAISIVREKETGTMETLLVSPVRPITIITAKAIPYMVLSCINVITIVLLSVFVLGVPLQGNLALLGLLSLLMVSVSLALGLLISSIAQTQVVAMMAAGLGVMMPTMMLSGLLFPVENMPGILRALSCIVPARWFIDAVRKVMIQGAGIELVAKDILILGGMAVALLAASVKKINPRLQ